MSQDPQARIYRHFSYACFFMAAVHIIAAVLAVVAVREGELGEISPGKLLRFIPEHLILWRTSCLFIALSSISFVIFVVLIREILDRRVAHLATLAIVFAAIAASNDLNGLFNMMVLFADLAQQFRSHGHFLVHETMQLAWAIMDQSLTQCLLIGNSVYAASGVLVVAAGFSSDGFPKWLAWTGLTIWLVAIGISILSFLGMLQWVLVLTLATVVVFVMWSVAMGGTYWLLAERRHEPADFQAEE